MKKQNSFSLSNEDGFGIWGAIILLALIGFTAAAMMKTVGIWTAVIGFVAVFIVVMFLANLSDIIRYNKISNM